MAAKDFSILWLIRFHLRGVRGYFKKVGENHTRWQIKIQCSKTSGAAYSLKEGCKKKKKKKKILLIHPKWSVVPIVFLRLNPPGAKYGPVIKTENWPLLISVCSLNKWRPRSYGNNLALTLAETENRAKWRTSFLLRPVICFYYLLGKTPHLSLSGSSQNDSCPHVNQLMPCMVQN